MEILAACSSRGSELGFWADEQHEYDRDDGGGGEDAEGRIQRHTAITQSAERPVGKPTAAYAYHVHDSVAGGPQVGSRDLTKNRHVVAIEESPAEAKQHQE